MRPLPFRIKIALLSSFISGVVLAAFGVSAFLMISRQKLENLDTEILSLASRHPGWISNRRDFDRLDESLSLVLGENRRNQVAIALKDRGGKVLHASPGWPGTIDPGPIGNRLADDPQAPRICRIGGSEGESAGAGRGRGGLGRGMGPGGGGGAFTKLPEFRTVASPSGDWRLGAFGNDDITLIVGLDARLARAELDHLRNRFLLALPVALAVVGLGGWLVAGRALRPLRAIASTAEQVTARGLDQRIPSSGEDPEIARVIQVLNRMMDRLENSFQQANRFSADASHELKTPLAIMQGELENALQEALPGSKEQRVFVNLLDETQRLKTITRGLLLLARADAGQLALALETIDMTCLVEGIIEDARALSEEAGLRFEVSLPDSLFVRADPVLFRTALLNLFVNAVKYNQPEGVVRVDLGVEGNRAVLRIGNSGAGIPGEDRSRVFTRFHRVDAARQRAVDGVGLGLSLAREIVRAHGGDVELQESRPGWTSFMLWLERIP